MKFGDVLPAATADLRTAVVIDYQNVHLTAHDLFADDWNQPKHQTLIDPLLFSERLVGVRNQRQEAGRRAAALTRVLVYRGNPSSEHEPKPYSRNQAQRSHWERDPRVHVTLRPLKYDIERDYTGAPALDANGCKQVIGSPREKGIDVLCALALVREAHRDDIDLVVLASLDSDLQPALDEADQLKTAKVETVSWYDPQQLRSFGNLRPTDRNRRLWNTRLNRADFQAVIDRTNYT